MRPVVVSQFCNYVLMNLFIAVILENFAIANEEKASGRWPTAPLPVGNLDCD